MAGSSFLEELQTNLGVSDERRDGAEEIFLSEFGLTALPPKHQALVPDPRNDNPILFRLSGNLIFDPGTTSFLSSDGVYILDVGSAVYTWVGKNISQDERRLAIQRTQTYLYKQQAEGRSIKASVPIVKVTEGEETDGFRQAIQRIQGEHVK
jgi:hypothetical protein